MTNTESKIKQCIEPIINNIGYNIYDVIYEKEGKDNYLRIFIDKENGIDLNDCEKVNNAITDTLDEKDFIKNSYMLEVSSPGIERRLREDIHLKQNMGNKIEVHTFKAIEKQKVLVGKLTNFDKDSITLELQIENKQIKIQKADISTIKTVFDWDEIQNNK